LSQVQKNGSKGQVRRVIEVASKKEVEFFGTRLYDQDLNLVKIIMKPSNVGSFRIVISKLINSPLEFEFKIPRGNIIPIL